MLWRRCLHQGDRRVHARHLSVARLEDLDEGQKHRDDQRPVKEAHDAKELNAGDDGQKGEHRVHVLAPDEARLKPVFDDERDDDVVGEEERGQPQRAGEGEDDDAWDEDERGADDGQKSQHRAHSAKEHGRADIEHPEAEADQSALNQARHAIADKNRAADLLESVNDRVFFLVGQRRALADKLAQVVAIDKERVDDCHHDAEVEGHGHHVARQVGQVAQSLGEEEGDFGQGVGRHAHERVGLKVDANPGEDFADALRQHAVAFEKADQLVDERRVFGPQIKVVGLGGEEDDEERERDDDDEDDQDRGDNGGGHAVPAQQAREPFVEALKKNKEHERQHDRPEKSGKEPGGEQKDDAQQAVKNADRSARVKHGGGSFWRVFESGEDGCVGATAQEG